VPRVTFIYPCMGRYPNTKYVRSWQMQPLAIAVLSALTPPEWEQSFYDDRLEEIDYNEPTDLVAISAEVYNAKRAYQIATEYHKKRVPVVMGGYHPTFCPDEALRHADAICIGEAEGIWQQMLVDTLKGKLRGSYQAPMTPDLKSITPNRRIFNDKNYFFVTLVETGRGCKFKCDFCAISAFYKATYRRRPVSDVVNELKKLKKKFVFFVDDNMVSNTTNAKELFRAIKPLGIKWVSQGSLNAATDPELLKLMAESGCQALLVGFESLSAANITEIGKEVNKEVDYAEAIDKFRRNGILLYGTFMFGLPDDSVELLKDTVEFAKKHKLWVAAFAHTVPFPGTPFYERCRDEGRLLYEQWWLSDHYRFGQVPYQPWAMTAAELEEICHQARLNFFAWPSVFRRALDFNANCRNLTKTVLYLAANILMHREIPQKRNLPLGLVDNTNSNRRTVRLKVADTTDDAGIRSLLRRTAMPGSIQIAYLREPSFFQALSVEGYFNQAFIGVDSTNEEIVGMSSRSIKTAFVNGRPTALGYLSTLRIAEPYRGGTYLARGYKLLKELHGDGRTRMYITTIIESNKMARRLLTSGRAGLPVYHDIGRYRCLAISLRQKIKTDDTDNLKIRSATTDDVPSIIEFLLAQGSRKQFFPKYTTADLGSQQGILRDLALQDIWLGYREGKLVGTVAAWDQRSFRQSLVTNYSRPLATIRPAYNLVARLLGYPILPPKGTILQYLNLSLICILDDDREVFATLLKRLMQQYRKCHSMFLAGLHESDPLLPVLEEHRHFSYDSRLYLACWEDGEIDYKALDNRVPYLELGAL